jgi:hypothetical protein
MIKGYIFKGLNSINRRLLPSYRKKNPLKLTKMQKAITAYRYWILIQSIK